MICTREPQWYAKVISSINTTEYFLMANLGKALLSTLMILSFITQSLSALSAPCPDMEAKDTSHHTMHMQDSHDSTSTLHMGMGMDCCDEDSCPMDSCSTSGLIFIPNTLIQLSSTEAPLNSFKQAYNSIKKQSLYRPPILS